MLKGVALSAGLIAGVHAFWRMECPGRVGLARIDPIISPNAASAHAHALHGSSAISDRSGSADLMDGDCTSCRVTQDKSAYWHPALYFEDARTRKVEVVPQVGGMLAYYLLYGNNVTAFPKGFQMVSGSNDRRSYTVGDPSQPDPPKSQWASLGQTSQSALEQRAVGFNCLNYAMAPEGTLYRHMLPDKSYLDQNCADGLRFELMFASCWNGKDIDSKNHKDHVAFPDLVMTGTCPETHPVRLPSLLFEVIWNTAAFKHRKGRFVISNGDVTGFGYHGDFVTGWEPDFLQKAIETCTNPSGRIQDCPLFNVVDESEAASCKMKKQPHVLSGENVLGPMPKLPGGISVGGMPADHDSGKKEPVATSSANLAPLPALTYRPGEKATAPASPLPGQAFKENKASSPPPPAVQPSVVVQALDGQATASPPAAVEPSVVQALDGQATAPQLPATPAPEPSYYSTQYITNGNIVTKVLWEETWVTVVENGDPPGASAAAAGHKHRRHVAHHVHGHGHAKF